PRRARPEAGRGDEGRQRPLRQPRGHRGDDRRRADPARQGADARRRLGGGVRAGPQGARKRHLAEARDLFREHLMAITVLDVQRVAVIGGGTMGTGIAEVAARAGYQVELYDVAQGAAQKALERIGDSLARAVEKGRCTAAEREEALGRLSAAAEMPAEADLIIEAAPEDLALKKDLFSRL